MGEETSMAHAADRAQSPSSRRAITLIGAPIEAGAGVRGCAMGPAMLRTAGIAETLAELGCAVEDRGDLKPEALASLPQPEGRARNFAEVSAWARALSRETLAVMRDGRTPVVLGGDHSLAMGSL